MKNAVTINISGTPFTVDEDAYELLRTYLEDIQSRLSGKEEREEVAADIESRVSEIFREKGANVQKVVDIALVRYVISVIGNPCIFGDGPAGTAGTPPPPLTPPCAGTAGTPPPPLTPPCTERRQLRRDPRGKVLGGVCSGLADYFAIDVSMVRIFTFLLVFLGGLSVWVYLMLWLVIPKATTPEEFTMLDRERSGR